jgi:hypothetical protein
LFSIRDVPLHSTSTGVPQGSVLGPLEFIAYTEHVSDIFNRYSLHHHLFADDKQVYASADLNGVVEMRSRLGDLITDVGSWCSSRRLQLNQSKTELAWFGKPSRLDSLRLQNTTVTVGTVTIQSSAVVRDLGVLLDSELSMKKHVAKSRQHVSTSCVDCGRFAVSLSRSPQHSSCMRSYSPVWTMDTQSSPGCRGRPSSRSSAYKTPLPASSINSERETMWHRR